LINNPYKPPSMPQEEDEINVNGVYKEFVLWSLLISALFLLLHSIRTVATSIINNILLVVRYVIDLNN